MNAFLLAAGLGTRLRPLTNEIPKCLVDICGKPLLQWWLEKLEAINIERTLINTHHLPQQVAEFAENYGGDIDIVLFHEPELLGSAGTVRENMNFVNDDHFLIIYADNLTNVDLRGIIDYHSSKDAVFTMGVMEMPRPETRGIAVLNDNGIVVEFVEKSPNPPGKLANAGIKVASPELFAFLDDKTPLDFGFDIFPKMVGIMHGYELNGYLRDIGNPEDLKAARMDWAELIRKQQIVS
ncbi:MAG: NTP transferase domain-containing protein [candidate division Zixibacteria bacterium]|nr:NTP transferase domain-containing protein [candidate division Zixibacteria bacterium]